MLIQGHQKNWVYGISEQLYKKTGERRDLYDQDKDNKVNFGKNGATPISSGTVGPGDGK